MGIKHNIRESEVPDGPSPEYEEESAPQTQPEPEVVPAEPEHEEAPA